MITEPFFNLNKEINLGQRFHGSIFESKESKCDPIWTKTSPIQFESPETVPVFDEGIHNPVDVQLSYFL